MEEALTDQEMLAKIREYVKGQGSATKAAKSLGLSATYVYDVLNGDRPPGALGVRLGFWSKTEPVYRTIQEQGGTAC